MQVNMVPLLTIYEHHTLCSCLYDLMGVCVYVYAGEHGVNMMLTIAFQLVCAINSNFES